jgi:hypothetical protein
MHSSKASAVPEKNKNKKNPRALKATLSLLRYIILSSKALCGEWWRSPPALTGVSAFRTLPDEWW